MRRSLGGVLIGCIAGLGVATTPAAAQIRAGAATVDATWHVGASAGQYASSPEPIDQEIDPHAHQLTKRPSYGVQSRLSARALVVQSAAARFAVVKIDLYIPQDLLWRRAAQILEQRGTGIGRSNLVLSVTHDHSSPYYTSTGVGAWLFQDVFDIRSFDYYAMRVADAVTAATRKLAPARVSAAAQQVAGPNRNALGPALADDGTPAGFPDSYTDRDMVLVRFDDISDPSRPRPLANLVNFALHPEGLSGNDLISADFVAPFERMMDRQTGALTVWTQGSVGNSEPERSSYHAIADRLEISHKEYAQAELAARTLADAAQSLWARAVTPEADVPPFSTGAVGFQDRWFPGPLTHPYPAVSNCRTSTTLGGNVLLPVLGLPDCQGVSSAVRDLGLDVPPVMPDDPGITADQLKALGLPVPDNYGVPSYGALQEDVSVHLQAFRIGPIAFTVCSCEQWADQSENIETRLDRQAGNEWAGFDWATYRGLDDTSAECFEVRPFNGSRWSCPHPETAQTTPCFRQADGSWSCPNPKTDCLLKGAAFTNTCRDAAGRPDLRDSRIVVSDARMQRMKAQVRNCANGWNALTYAPYAESEPLDVRAIKGNYSCDDSARSAQLGYALVVPIAMADDYNGYIATYREYQRGDHYRKALTGWGAHSSDYMATRLVKMARSLNGGPPLDRRLDGSADPDADNPLLTIKTLADQAAQDVKATALGTLARTVTTAYEALLPDDGGAPQVTRQPPDVERFDAALFSFVGGSNYTDDPQVRVQRLVDDTWTDVAGQAGEVVVTLRFPARADELPAYVTGDQRWEWTAHWETFVSAFDLGDTPRATPAGTYRFVADGRRREGRQVVGYRVASREFEVRPWSGLTAEDLQVEEDGRASFDVGPRRTVAVPGGNPATTELGPIDYPDGYDHRVGRARFLRTERSVIRDPAAPADPSRFEWFCLTCSFRPWLDTGDASEAVVTLSDGTRTPATPDADGRWRTAAAVPAGGAVAVCPGDLRDAYGNVNGAAASTGPVSCPH